MEPRRTHEALPACYAAADLVVVPVGRRRQRRPGRAAQRRPRGDGQRPARWSPATSARSRRRCVTASPAAWSRRGDADALAAAITELVDRPDVRRSLGTPGPGRRRDRVRPRGLHRGVLRSPGGDPWLSGPSATCSRATRAAPSCSSPARSGGWSSCGVPIRLFVIKGPTRPSTTTWSTGSAPCPAYLPDTTSLSGQPLLALAAREPRRRSGPRCGRSPAATRSGSAGPSRAAAAQSWRARHGWRPRNLYVKELLQAVALADRGRPGRRRRDTCTPTSPTARRR